MPDYRERLRAPTAWWLIAAGCVLVFGTELFAGFSLTVGIIVYLVLALICAATLLHWGGAVVQVGDGELRAGQIRVPLGQVAQAQPLDEAQTRAMRGPRADPAAYLLIRPYLRQSVYVRLGGPVVQYRKRIIWSAVARRPTRITEPQVRSWPYLLIGSRRPAELAGAIGRPLVSAD